jgi:hypothetical protein
LDDDLEKMNAPFGGLLPAEAASKYWTRKAEREKAVAQHTTARGAGQGRLASLTSSPPKGGFRHGQ